ncbi:hypothetical protein [Hymenobacter sp. GOD-10R]|uniref:hypothetical protein n=1 Tax=Hymenobacter sp. GOD-10R TaxID=3093922 RepID=UPI002D77EEFB|nr:hypothetical protein [Hymenobacter sp. GOD-10R]WRQ30716.1 hypothetical protein SD425_10630 [Hymenobacter sp. GOD-10R]
MKRLLIAPLAFLTMYCTSAPEEMPEPAICPIFTGVTGTVRYGQGDCMPLINEQARTYSPYTGELYFIRKAALDQLGNGDFEQLRAASLHYPLRDGRLSADVPAGTYVVMPTGVYLYQPTNTITVVAGQALQQDFKFWKCLVY